MKLITNSQIKFKSAILKLILQDHNDTYILFKRTIIIFGEGADDVARAAD